MHVTAMLSWYDEPLELLEDGIRSLAGACDRVVALDGAYQFTPGASPTSPPEQAAVIRRAAEDAGITCHVHPGRIWRGQIEKRQRLLNLCRGSDWLLVHDADHRLDGDPEGFRDFLAGRADDVVTVELSYRTLAVKGKRITPWHDWLTEEPFYAPLVLRNLPEFRIELHHWWYSGILQGKRVALQGWDFAGGDPLRAGEIPPGRHERTDTLQVTHRCFERPEETLERQRGLYAARAELVAAHGSEL